MVRVTYFDPPEKLAPGLTRLIAELLFREWNREVIKKS
jgi:hypothetical protein